MLLRVRPREANRLWVYGTFLELLGRGKPALDGWLQEVGWQSRGLWGQVVA